ncbi:PspA/IM30 family protein OS=Streptomyces tendae OX=1932 GN=GUR47_11630 PE=3 SV=1 [Streptomyces tendae]
MKAELAGGSTADRQAIEGGQGQGQAPSQSQQQPQDTPRFDKQ